jgi:mannose-6-phosphate isomerase-like protein (cupin superfamily)
MSATHVVWDELPWQQGNHPLEFKKVVEGRPCVMLMFMPGFADPNLCQRSHVLHVLEGQLSLELEGQKLQLGPGECCVLAAGTSHRARNDAAEPVIVLAVSDLGWD